MMKHVLPLAVLAVLVSGCQQQSASLDSPTVVEVGKAGITQIELEQALKTLPEASRTAERANMLDQLVNQQLFADAAKQAGMEKQPEVIAALRQAERKVLASQYAQGLVKDLPKPDAKAVAAYYDAHPDAFQKRRIYKLREIVINAPTDKYESIRLRLTQGGSLQDLIKWLQAQGFKGRINEFEKASNDLPDSLARELAAMQPGQLIALPMANNLSVVFLLASANQPVSVAQATPAIESLLLVQARDEAVKKAADTLRAATPPKYSEGYAPAAPAAGPANSPAAAH
jgi:EpsD family peptidyl-prolyl cis-trans isomerase